MVEAAKIMKNINTSEVVVLKDQINYQEGQVVSKTLIQNKALNITLFSFDKGEEISTHSSKGETYVVVLDGVGKFTIADEEYFVKEGEAIVMPANVPHAVFAPVKFKMQLVVVF